jgi:hypothetical protein
MYLSDLENYQPYSGILRSLQMLINLVTRLSMDLILEIKCPSSELSFCWLATMCTTNALDDDRILAPLKRRSKPLHTCTNLRFQRWSARCIKHIKCVILALINREEVKENEITRPYRSALMFVTCISVGCNFCSGRYNGHEHVNTSDWGISK